MYQKNVICVKISFVTDGNAGEKPPGEKSVNDFVVSDKKPMILHLSQKTQTPVILQTLTRSCYQGKIVNTILFFFRV